MSTTEFLTNLSEADNRHDNTTQYIDFNQTTSPYEVASTPVSGLTYTLFGLTCFFACLGLAGNLSILTIALKAQGTWKGHDVLITALAVSDCVALISTALTQPCFYEVVGMDVRAITTVGCKVFMSVWFSAMFC